MPSKARHGFVSMRTEANFATEESFYYNAQKKQPQERHRSDPITPRRKNPWKSVAKKF
jgi:hypothetical protein